MSASFQTCLAQLDQLESVLRELTELAQRETQAVNRGDLKAVDEIMRREQALSLSLRGLDQKREKLMAELGLQGVRLSGLAEHAPPELEMETRQKAEQVTRQYAVYRDANQVARTTLECDLHLIQAHMNTEQPEKPQGPHKSVADIRA